MKRLYPRIYGQIRPILYPRSGLVAFVVIRASLLYGIGYVSVRDIRAAMVEQGPTPIAQEWVFMSALFVYVTMPDVDTAKRIAREAVRQRVCACANLLSPLWSCYHWQGAVEEADEVACIFKTTEARFPAFEACVRALHPYEVPCIVALPVLAGNQDFLHWIQEETAPDQRMA